VSGVESVDRADAGSNPRVEELSPASEPIIAAQIRIQDDECYLCRPCQA
jgi:hypothetical protein